MEKVSLVTLIIGCAFILFGYFRFITDDKGHVDLNNYRFTGGIMRVIKGMFAGTQDMFSRHLSANGFSAVLIYLGIMLFFYRFQYVISGLESLAGITVKVTFLIYSDTAFNLDLKRV